MKKKKLASLKIIGSLDHVDFPTLSLFDLPCKIDTGAETSAIHCHKVKLVERDGQEWISFYLLDPSHPNYNGIEYRVKDFTEKRIKNSFGQSEYRYTIQTEVIIFGEVITADFTLSDRENMKYPVLLGKKILKKRFLVDVNQTDLSCKQKQLQRNS